jgi:hypothetical protein
MTTKAVGTTTKAAGATNKKSQIPRAWRLAVWEATSQKASKEVTGLVTGGQKKAGEIFFPRQKLFLCRKILFLSRS